MEIDGKILNQLANNKKFKQIDMDRNIYTWLQVGIKSMATK